MVFSGATAIDGAADVKRFCSMSFISRPPLPSTSRRYGRGLPRAVNLFTRGRCRCYRGGRRGGTVLVHRDALKRLWLFTELTDAYLDQIRALARVQRYPAR